MYLQQGKLRLLPTHLPPPSSPHSPTTRRSILPSLFPPPRSPLLSPCMGSERIPSSVTEEAWKRRKMVDTKQTSEAIKFVGLQNELRDRCLLMSLERSSKSQGVGYDRQPELLDTKTGRNKRVKLRKVKSDINRDGEWEVHVRYPLTSGDVCFPASHWQKKTHTQKKTTSLKTITQVEKTTARPSGFYLFHFQKILQDRKGIFHVCCIGNTVMPPRVTND